MMGSVSDNEEQAAALIHNWTNRILPGEPLGSGSNVLADDGDSLCDRDLEELKSNPDFTAIWFPSALVILFASLH